MPIPTPDRTRIVSPELASAEAFFTPTPRANAAPATVRGLLKTAPAVVSITAGGTTGELNSDSGVMSDGTYVNGYEYIATAGEFLSLALTSETFDPLLLVVNDAGDVVAFNDDFDPKTSGNSRVGWTVPKDGVYQFLVATYSEAEGTYTLTFAVEDHATQGQSLLLNTPVQGWLAANDNVAEDGLWADRWTLTLPDTPVVVLATSDETDIRIAAYDAEGNLIVKNGDWDRVASDFDARVMLTPSSTLPAGSEVTIEVGLQGKFAIAGAYELRVVPLATAFPLDRTVVIRSVIVHGANGERGSQITEDEFSKAIANAQAIWRQCGINLVVEEGGIRTVSVPGLEFTIHVEIPLQRRGLKWTPEEEALLSDPSHAPLADGVITVYAVRLIGQGAQRGYSYPSSRYPSEQSGAVIVADNELRNPVSYATLAHEIGHILGVNHPDLDDGDSLNDTAENMMFPGMLAEDGQTVLIYGGVTPMQCTTARNAPHFVQQDANTDTGSDALRRTDRNLIMGVPVVSALTVRDPVTADAEAQYLDVYYFHGNAGDKIQIDLTSADFDPFLIVDSPDRERLALEDDSGAGWNAKATLTLPKTGDYSIGVTSFLQSVGTYELQVNAAP